MRSRSKYRRAKRTVLPSLAVWFVLLGSAQAQPASSPDAVEQVQVTASRLNISSYQQPTPVTIVTAEQMQRDVQPDLVSTLQQLPSMGPVSTPFNSNGTQNISAGVAGISLANMRNLGSGRTLVLFDGVRAVQSSEAGGVDLALLPSTLVQRIDVVTGGASAAWGSDAVAGVINIILNKQYSGLQLNISGGSDEKNLTETGKIEAAYGTDLLNDRGHLILSASYLDSPKLSRESQYPWFHSQGLIGNPAFTATNGQPQLIHVDRVGLEADSQGGIVTTGPLKGLMFGPGGTPQAFTFGNVTGVVQSGGTFLSPQLNGEDQDLNVPIRALQLYGHFSYKLTDSINANFEFNYGRTDTKNSSLTYTRNDTITIDNPYIDPSVVARMQTAGISSFVIGTTNANNMNIGAGDDPLTAPSVGEWRSDVVNTLSRQVVALDGSVSLFGNWDWKLTFEHSSTLRHTHIMNDPIVANYNLAIDAVRVTSANVGSSGLPISSIACRSTLTSPSNGCVPLNVLGIGVADPAAIAYINSGPAYSDLSFGQYAADGQVQGQPFSTWAGPVSVALGFDYRRESSKQSADALSYARAYSIGNFQPYSAAQDDYEGFCEIEVPLLKDDFVQSLDLNAAVREINYSSSGPVTTWKFGATSQLNNDIRLRGTISRDIRAPYLTALYNPGSTTIQIVNDPVKGPTNVISLSSGNPDLKPEVATTYSAGVVFTPSWIDGLSAYVDWYHIDIAGAFASPVADFIIKNCAAGVQLYCALIVRDANGFITTLLVRQVNSASQIVEGYDFQADYRQPLFGGEINFSLLGNYTRDNVSNVLNVVTHSAGDQLGVFGGGGFPKVRGTLDVTYSQDRFSGTVQFRGLSSALLNSGYGATGVDNNNIPAQGYIDLRASYKLLDDQNLQFDVAIDNLLARDPPIIPQAPTAAFVYFFVPTRTDIYDFQGRVYRVAARWKL